MPDIQIRLRLDADGNAVVVGMNRVSDSLQRVADTGDQAQAATGNLAEQLVGFGIGAASIGAIAAALTSWIDAAREAEVAQTKLTTTMRGVTGASDEQIQGLQELAFELQKTTGYDDDATVAAQARLGTYGLTADAIAALTPGLLDMAESARQAGSSEADLDSITKALGKAYTTGLTALRRYGVAVSDVQAQQFEAATTGERTAILVQLLAERFGGLAEAVGETYEGANRKAAASLGDLAQALGELVTKSDRAPESLGTYAEVVNWATEAVTENAEAIRTLIGDAGLAALPALLTVTVTKLLGYAQALWASTVAQAEAARTATLSAAAEANAAAARVTAAQGSVAMAAASQAEAKATLIAVEARALEMPYLVRTASYQAAVTTARTASVAATRALIAAEAGLAGASAGLATAQAAQAAAATAGAVTWRTLLSATSALKVGLSALIGVEVGRWIRGWVEDTETGRAAIEGLDLAFGALSTTYREAVEAEQSKAETDAIVLAKMKEISTATGVAISDQADLNRKVESGELVWNGQRGAWEKGIPVLGQLAAGLGEVDTAYARLADVLDRLSKLEGERAKLDTQAAKSAAERAKLAGDEAGALEILARARAAEVTAAERQVDIRRALLAEAEAAIAQQVRETDTTAAGSAARQARIAELQALAEERQLDLAAAQASADQAKVDADQARMVAATWGDQSAALSGLIQQRDAAVAALARHRDAIAAAATAEGQLAAAQQALVTAQALAQQAIGQDVEDLTRYTQAHMVAQEEVARLEAAVRAGAAAEAATVDIKARMVKLNNQIADAARDAATAADLQTAAIGRELEITQARSAVTSAQLTLDLDRAKALGDVAAQVRLGVEAARLEVEQAETTTAAKQAEAAALADKAAKLDLAARAVGDYTVAEQEEVAQARHAAEMAKISAEQLGVLAEAKRAAATETARLAEQERALGEAMADAGVKGVKAMDDIASAISAAATGPELEALEQGLREAIAAGAEEAGKLSAALDEVLAKAEDLQATASGKTFTNLLDAESLAAQFTGRDRAKDLEGWLQSWGNDVPAADITRKVQAIWRAQEGTQAAGADSGVRAVASRRVVDINLRTTGGDSTLSSVDEDEAERLITVLRRAQLGAT